MKEPIVIRGLGDAIARERLIRDAVFLDVPESIAGFAVHPMTLRHYMALKVAGNPLLYRATPSDSQLAQFLWTVSVDYKPAQSAFTAWFFRSGLLDPNPPKWKSRRAISDWLNRLSKSLQLRANATSDAHRYVSDTMQDRPPIADGPAQSFYSEACYWCACISREFSVHIDDVPDMPLKKLFQFLNEMKHHYGQPVSNPSAKVIAQWQAEQNRN